MYVASRDKLPDRNKRNPTARLAASEIANNNILRKAMGGLLPAMRWMRRSR
jgi:hypothetical protein